MTERKVPFICYGTGTHVERIELPLEENVVLGPIEILHAPERIEGIKLEILVPDFLDGEERITHCPITGYEIVIGRNIDIEEGNFVRKIHATCGICWNLADGFQSYNDKE